jgi:3-phytase
LALAQRQIGEFGMRQLVISSIAAAMILAGCASTEDRLAAQMLIGLPSVASAPASVETVPVGSGDDAADDPAIWVNPTNPADSLILGTDKQAGLYVYNLSGAVVQYLPVGRLNNVDVRQNVTSPSGMADFAVASNRSDNSVSVFSIDRSSGRLALVSSFSTGDEPYGICAADGRSQGGDGLIVAVTYKSGAVVISRISETGQSGPRQTASLSLSSQVEGCVFDEMQNALFIGEEDVGLWRVNFSGTTPSEPILIDRAGSGSGLVADVEGVGLWAGLDGSGYLVVSSQLADRYMVYERAAPNRLVGAFSIGPRADGAVDGVTHTDGLEVTAATLGPSYPTGLMVVQDDSNTHPARVVPYSQNFKLVDWRAIAPLLSQPSNR